MPPNPIEVHGVVYPSRKAAARALKVAPDTIRRAEREGKLDMVGVKKYKITAVVRYTRNSADAMEYRIWKSIKTAAAATGLTEWYVKTYAVNQLRGWRIANPAEVAAMRFAEAKKRAAARKERDFARYYGLTADTKERPNVGDNRENVENQHV